MCVHGCRDLEKSRLMNSSSTDQSIDMMLMRSTLPPSIAAAVAPSSGVRPPSAAVSVPPPTAATAARAAWSSGEWLQTSVYQQRLREVAYRRDISALWAAAIKQQQLQQHRTGRPDHRFTS